MRNLIFFLLFLSQTQISWGQSGIKGVVEGPDGPLPFATVYIRNLNTGAATNVDGEYELRLPIGKYDLVFQYIGYESQVQFVEVVDQFTRVNIKLSPQVILLREVEIRAGKEDPAYTIMRKSIAKAKYHTQQIDSFNTKVYIKGSGRLLDSPFFLRKRIEKEGIDSTMAFTSESYSELHYERPNKIKQKVIAVHSKGEDNGTGPAEIINESFYQPMVIDAVSPLSPKAFAYYRFEYQGSFKEEDHLINKIRVIPRSKGDGVFDGSIFIVEDVWSIHSLDLRTSRLGIAFKINQIYAPIEEVAWLPISHKIDVRGTFFGFEFEYNYLATLKDYEVSLNPDLEIEFQVIDEKIDAPVSSIKPTTDAKESTTLEKLANQKEVNRKDLRKLLREYEKEELKRSEEPDLLSNINFIEDTSTFYNEDSTYWNAIRPVPLSTYERKGYVTIDSLENVGEEKTKRDSTKSRTFKPWDILFGKTLRLGENSRLQLKAPIGTIAYNTVEGYAFEFDLSFQHQFKEDQRLSFGPIVRYSFARNKVVGKLSSQFQYGKGLKRSQLRLEAGRYLNQLNEEAPIHPIINTFTALFLEQSFLKPYEKDFVKVSLDQKVGKKLTLEPSFEIAERRFLTNQTDHVWINQEDRQFTPNNPDNLLFTDTSFPEHQATIISLRATFSPWQKYKMTNGILKVVDESSPQFSLLYRGGYSGVLASDVSFNLLEAGYKHQFNWGIRGKVDFQVMAGRYFNQSEIFVDFKHFLGNQTPFATTDPASSYRLLNYYLYSTNNEYLSAFVHNQFRRLAITQFPLIRTIGLKENLFVNYLATSNAEHYTEIGYGLDYIFRVFRLEVIAAFQDGSYQDIGFRVGIATNLDNLF